MFTGHFQLQFRISKLRIHCHDSTPCCSD